MTWALGKNYMKAIGLHMALDLIHQKRQRDMITGLMTKTEAGRPEWNQVLMHLDWVSTYGYFDLITDCANYRLKVPVHWLSAQSRYIMDMSIV